MTCCILQDEDADRAWLNEAPDPEVGDNPEAEADAGDQQTQAQQTQGAATQGSQKKAGARRQAVVVRISMMRQAWPGLAGQFEEAEQAKAQGEFECAWMLVMMMMNKAKVALRCWKYEQKAKGAHTTHVHVRALWLQLPQRGLPARRLAGAAGAGSSARPRRPRQPSRASWPACSRSSRTPPSHAK